MGFVLGVTSLKRSKRCADCKERIKPGEKVLVDDAEKKVYCRSQCAVRRLNEYRSNIFTLERVLFGDGGA